MDDPRNQEQTHYLPDPDRLSVLAATIMLAYSLTQFVNFPSQEVELALPWIVFSIQINIQSVVALLVAGLTAAGADWLFRDHPALRGRSALPYVLLPALTSLVIGSPLNQLSFSWAWWLGLLVGGSLLVLVLVGEYISMDTEGVRQPLAAAGLTALSFALFLIFATSLRSENLRLFILVPLISLGAGLVSIRVFHLRLHGEWLLYESIIISFLVGQLAAAFHYWPLTTLSFGLLLLGPTYALNSLLVGLIEGNSLRNTLLESVAALFVAIFAAWWAR